MKCTVLADVIGNQKLCTGFGMIMFAAGFTVFLGPSLAGAFSLLVSINMTLPSKCLFHMYIHYFKICQSCNYYFLAA